jgi:toxin YoeB
MREVAFSPEGWEEYLSLEKKEQKKVNALIKDTQRNGNNGIGHPEPLLGDKKGYFSKEIDKGNRMVYALTDDKIKISSVKGHYDDH